MKTIAEYIIEKLVIDKDTKTDVWDKFEKGDVCLVLIHLKNMQNIKECVTINVVKINDINRKNETISPIAWSSTNNKFTPSIPSVENKVIGKNGYLYDAEHGDVPVIYASKNDALKLLDMIQKYKTIDFNSLVGEESKQLDVTMNLTDKINDETIKKFKELLNENNK